MRIARVPLLLLIGYVLLDIANPLMPGAVQLVHGTIQVVEADRARDRNDVHVPATLPPARLTATPAPWPRPPERRRTARRAPCRRRLHPKRPRRRTALAADEDH